MDLEQEVKRAEAQRRKVVALAVELEAWGGGDPFEGPVRLGHAKRGELVDRIMCLTGYDVSQMALSATYRYEWCPEAAKVLPSGAIVCETRVGFAFVRPAGVCYLSVWDPDLPDVSEVFGYIEELVGDALEGWECMSAERAAEAAYHVYQHLEDEHLEALRELLPPRSRLEELRRMAE